MSIIRTSGIILHKIPYSESSVILKTYTRESGLISLMAKGAKRPKSKFRGLLDLFTEYELLYREKNNNTIITLQEASFEKQFTNIAKNIQKQSLANIFLEIYLRHLYGPEQSAPLYESLENNLADLNVRQFPPANAPLYLCDFLLQFCGLMGFKPQFVTCIHCQEHPSITGCTFDLEMGGPICLNCKLKSRFRSNHLPSQLMYWLTEMQTRGAHAGLLAPNKMKMAEELLLSFLYTQSSRGGQLKAYPFYRSMI